jgi:hypothetical protein
MQIQKTDLSFQCNIKAAFFRYYPFCRRCKNKQTQFYEPADSNFNMSFPLYVSEVGSDGLSVVGNDKSPKQIRT